MADFEYEYQMAGMNQQLNDRIETVFLMADVSLADRVKAGERNCALWRVDWQIRNPGRGRGRCEKTEIALELAGLSR